MAVREFSIVDVVGIRSYREEVAEVAGVEMKLASLREDEAESILSMIDRYYYENANPAVRSLIVENAELTIDLVRAVKAETKQEFAGPIARGNQLTITDLTADHFTNVWGSTGATDFTYTASSTGSTAYIGTSSAPESVAEEEGYVFLGFIEMSPTPKTNKILLTKNGDPYPYSNFVWNADEDFYLAPLPEPYFFPPESSYYINVNFHKTGSVEMKPIGFKVLQAKNVLSL